jgi:6-pyruvoyltetrahydropterin/6-carboxytetrahydropterin synthase
VDATITKSFSFEASHQLPHHRGKCSKLHGHSYVAEISVKGPIQEETGEPESGMVVDFDELSRAAKEIIDSFDHSHLNDHLNNPTAENIATRIKQYMEYSGKFVDVRVKLYETENSWVEVGI